MATDRLREGGVSVPGWWVEAAKVRRDTLKLSQLELAAAVAKRMGVNALIQSRISKALRGENATIPLLDAISAVLGIPPPVWVAESMEEAGDVAAVGSATRTRERLLADGKAKLAGLRQKALEIERQTGAGYSANGAQEGRPIGGASHARRGTGGGRS